MTKTDPQFMWVGLILPTLFAMTLMADGIMKFMRKEPPWISFGLGLVFLSVIFIFYFILIP